MLRNRSRQIDHSERVKKHRETEMLILLEKCSQIPKDDRIILRNLLKEGNEGIVTVLSHHKKDGVLGELQIELRKLVAAYRNKMNDNYEFCKESKRPSCRVTSLPGTHRQIAPKQPQPLQLRLVVDRNTFNITKAQNQPVLTTTGNVLKSRYYQGVEDAAEGLMTTSEIKRQFEKKIEAQIDSELERELKVLSIEQVQNISIPDVGQDESLNESLMQQFRLGEPLNCYSRSNISLSLQPSSTQLYRPPSESMNQIQTPTLNLPNIPFCTSVTLSSGEPQDTMSNLKQNAKKWYRQFMEVNSKFVLEQSFAKPEEQQFVQKDLIHPQAAAVSCPSSTAPTRVGDLHKKGLSLNLQGLVHSQSSENELFSFRKQKQASPKYGQFYKRLKMELQGL